jgi:hypothetical protein
MNDQAQLLLNPGSSSLKPSVLSEAGDWLAREQRNWSARTSLDDRLVPLSQAWGSPQLMRSLRSWSRICSSGPV